MKLSCHCGLIRIELARRPDYINECNCSLCRKSGARWSYLDPAEVTVSGEAAGYTREDKVNAGAEIRFCPNCGSTTHFNLTASAAEMFGNTMMGVNMRLADERSLAGLELRFPDGAAWPGEGEFGFVSEPRILG